MISIGRFIHHSNTEDIICQLDATLVAPPSTRRITLMYGAEATGKRALFSHWATLHQQEQRGPTPELAPIVLVEARRTFKTTGKRDVYATPVTFNLFSDITFVLGEIAQRLGRPVFSSKWYRPTGGQLTQGQFNALYNCVRSDFHSLQARALAILQAQQLDLCAFEMLLRWYEYRQRQFALMLCFTLPKNARFDQVSEPIYQALNHIGGSSTATYFADPLELPRLTRKEFGDHLLGDILDELQIPWPESIDAQRMLAESAWKKTGGDWKSIDDRVRALRLKLSGKVGAERALTPEMIKEIFDC